MIRVLVVDDQQLVCSGITSLLKDAEGIEVIGQAGSGEEAIEVCRKLEPEIVLMDVRMPGIGGVEATRKILQHHEDAHVIAISASDDSPHVGRLLKAGASGYLTKGASFDEMVRAIIKVRSGQKYLTPEIAQKMALKPFESEEASPFDDLSEREMQIAMMIVDCQKVQAISEKLFLSPKTVNSYRYRIFEKLEIDSDVELTHMAVRHGLVDPSA